LKRLDLNYDGVVFDHHHPHWPQYHQPPVTTTIEDKILIQKMSLHDWRNRLVSDSWRNSVICYYPVQVVATTKMDYPKIRIVGESEVLVVMMIVNKQM
jgi:hypothetical protein